MPNLLDEILLTGGWAQWRQSSNDDPTTLAAAARHWLVSSYWETHTPRLEDWKVVLDDLGPARLSESDLHEMAKSRGHDIAFPPIPLFEGEQVADILRILQPSSFVVLAEQLTRTKSLLTVDSATAAELCWQALPDGEKLSLEYSAWRWLVPAGEQELPWPSLRGVTQLVDALGARSGEALLRLEAAARQSNHPAAAAVLATLSPAPVTVIAETYTPPLVENAGIDDAVESIAAAALASDLANRLHYQQICDQLFATPGNYPDIKPWEDIAQQLTTFSTGDASPHPLSVMAQYLRGRDFPVRLEELAWKKLSSVLRRCNSLMHVVDVTRPLPALELAACLRSSATVGRVAVDLILLDPPQMEQPDWWKALRLGLAPAVRRSGWGHANDRTLLAVAAVAGQKSWLTGSKKAAFESGFGSEGER